MEYKTTHLRQAAALLAQDEFTVSYRGVELTERPGQMNFVFEIEEDKVFHDWKIRYINDKTIVEPKKYDSKLNILRDSLNCHRT